MAYKCFTQELEYTFGTNVVTQFIQVMEKVGEID